MWLVDQHQTAQHGGEGHSEQGGVSILVPSQQLQ